MTAKWYKQEYCTAGVQKLPYHAVCTCIRYGSSETPAQPWYKRYCTPGERKQELYHAACTCIQYSSDAPTVSKKAVTKLIRVQSTSKSPTWQKNNWTLTRNENETGEEREAKKEEGRKGKMRKEVINVEFANKQMWHHNGCKLANIKSWYQHGRNGAVQWVYGNCWKVRQYVVNHEWGKIRAGQRRNHFLFHVWLAQNWIGQRDYLAADVCKRLLTAHENCWEKKIAHKICSQWANLLWSKICSINLLPENHELPFIQLAI